LESLLRFRENQRNRCRQLIAEVLADDRRLIDTRTQYEQHRAEILNEMRTLGQTGSFDISKVSSRRFHASQLTAQMSGIDEQRKLLSQQIELCRQALVKSDQEVKVLEKLKERQQQEFKEHLILQENREREELFLAQYSRS